MNVGRGARRWAPVAVVLLLLVTVGLVATQAGVQATKLPPLTRPSSVVSPEDEPGEAAASAEAEAVSQGDVSGIPSWVITLALGIMVAIMISVVVAVLWTVAKQSISVHMRSFSKLNPDTKTPEQRAAEVRDAVAASLTVLDDGSTDPRRAVIACWLRLEAVAASAGTVREAGDTPAELITRLLGDHELSAPSLAELAELYRLARYAPHAVPEGMRDRARAALGRLHSELASSPVAPS